MMEEERRGGKLDLPGEIEINFAKLYNILQRNSTKKWELGVKGTGGGGGGLDPPVNPCLVPAGECNCKMVKL